METLPDNAYYIGRYGNMGRVYVTPYTRTPKKGEPNYFYYVREQFLEEDGLYYPLQLARPKP